MKAAPSPRALKTCRRAMHHRFVGTGLLPPHFFDSVGKWANSTAGGGDSFRLYSTGLRCLIELRHALDAHGICPSPRPIRGVSCDRGSFLGGYNLHSNSRHPLHSVARSPPSVSLNQRLLPMEGRSYATWQSRGPSEVGPEPKPQPYRYLCVLDFEATCDQSKHRFWPQEIIEFPVVIVDTESLSVVDEFHHFVRPLINPKLTPFCKDLTGITQEEVDGGKLFADALSSLQDFLLQKGYINSSVNNVALEASTSSSPSSPSIANSDSATPSEQPAYPFLFVTCGDWDLRRMLPTQAKLSNVHVPEYLKSWANVKQIASDYYGKPASWSMRTLLRFLKLPMVGRHHSGIDDSRNIANAVISMIKDGCVFVPTGNTHRLSPSPALSDLAEQLAPNASSPHSSVSNNRQGFGMPTEPAVAAKPRELEMNVQEIDSDLFDIGANLTHPFILPHIDEVLQNAVNARVKDILVLSSSLDSAKKALAVCQEERFKDLGLNLVCSAGIHPHQAEKMIRRYGNDSEVVNALKEFVLEAPSKVKAIGECGLDFENPKCARRYQESLLHKQIDLAIELNLPLLLHERNAHKYLIPILEPKSHQMKCMIRCFSGSIKEMEKYLELGCYLGMSGLICDERKNGDLVEALKHIPLNKFILESNSPFNLPRNIPSPQSLAAGDETPLGMKMVSKAQKRYRRNEPHLLSWIAHKLAAIQNVSPLQIVEASNQNVNEFLNSNRVAVHS